MLSSYTIMNLSIDFIALFKKFVLGFIGLFCLFLSSVCLRGIYFKRPGPQRGHRDEPVRLALLAQGQPEQQAGLSLWFRADP